MEMSNLALVASVSEIGGEPELMSLDLILCDSLPEVNMKAMLILAVTGSLLSAAPVFAGPIDKVIVGVNISNNDGTLSQAFQDEEIKQLTDNHKRYL
jgi:hypothetical protein